MLAVPCLPVKAWGCSHPVTPIGAGLTPRQEACQQGVQGRVKSESVREKGPVLKELAVLNLCWKDSKDFPKYASGKTDLAFLNDEL